MKKTLSAVGTLIFILFLAGCSNDNGRDRAADRNANRIDQRNVNYNNPNHGGPAMTSVDISDPELDRNKNLRRNGNTTYDNNRNARLRLSEDAADRIADIKGVDHAKIIVNDNNAFVAVKLERTTQDRSTSTIKNKITRKVKSVDTSIDRVYISTNPEFYNRMTKYSHNLRNGTPVSGFINEFSDTIRRVFPDAR